MKRITLEMSLKPFLQTDDEYITAVCERVFEQWSPLLSKREQVAVMLWTADGSELLDWRGRLDDTIEWAYFVGGANPREGHPPSIDPAGSGLHTRNYLYTENPPVVTYRILQRIVSTLKEVGHRRFPTAQILVGTTFDPGPEFARSSFKYERHNEICMGATMGERCFICSYATLHADDTPYAAFPDGIPEGLPFGTFFGRQTQAFLDAMGFDYLWMSNGLGFGRDPWDTKGAVFDGKGFDHTAFADVKNKVMDFWRLFREGCPEYPIETRGTNMSMGIDLATDGVPLKEIYDGVNNLLPPPNSPWAALNGDFGLELMGHMSRIAKLPSEEYLFRYYIHDPWWRNSPWYDRYNGLPHDIYLPLATARIDRAGNTCPPTLTNILSIDNSCGELPDACVYEPLPHLLKGIKEAPDAPGAVVWAYPFEEYSAAESPEEIAAMFAGDWFVRGVINAGVPVNTVVATDYFVQHDPALYAASVLLSPVPRANSAYEEGILRYAADGGRVIFYGSTVGASERFCALVGVTHGTPREGELPLGGLATGMLKHVSLVSGGAITEEAVSPLITAGDKAVMTANGSVVWMRGTVSADYTGAQLLRPHDPQQYVRAEEWMALGLARLGIVCRHERPLGEPSPVMTVHRHNHAFWFSAYLPSTTVKTSLRFPYGAPVLDAHEAVMENGCAVYHFGKCEHRECRAFVEQASGVVKCRELPPVSWEYRRRVEVSGLQNATVRFLAEEYCKDRVTAVLNSQTDFWVVGDPFECEQVTIDGLTFCEVRNVTGTLVFSMPQS